MGTATDDGYYIQLSSVTETLSCGEEHIYTHLTIKILTYIILKKRGSYK